MGLSWRWLKACYVACRCYKSPPCFEKKAPSGPDQTAVCEERRARTNCHVSFFSWFCEVLYVSKAQICHLWIWQSVNQIVCSAVFMMSKDCGILRAAVPLSSSSCCATERDRERPPAAVIDTANLDLKSLLPPRTHTNPHTYFYAVLLELRVGICCYS